MQFIRVDTGRVKQQTAHGAYVRNVFKKKTSIATAVKVSKKKNERKQKTKTYDYGLISLLFYFYFVSSYREYFTG